MGRPFSIRKTPAISRWSKSLSFGLTPLDAGLVVFTGFRKRILQYGA